MRVPGITVVKEHGLAGVAKQTVGVDRGNLLLDVRVNAHNSEDKRKSDIRLLEDLRARSYDIRI